MPKVLGVTVFFLLCIAASGVLAQAGAERPSDPREIYGRELMTPGERDAYRERMRTLRTDVERERYRQDHRSWMQDRALRRGGALPPPSSEDWFFQREERSGDAPAVRSDGLRRRPQGESAVQRQWPPSSDSGSGAAGGLRRFERR